MQTCVKRRVGRIDVETEDEIREIHVELSFETEVEAFDNLVEFERIAFLVFQFKRSEHGKNYVFGNDKSEMVLADFQENFYGVGTVTVTCGNRFRSGRTVLLSGQQLFEFTDEQFRNGGVFNHEVLVGEDAQVDENRTAVHIDRKNGIARLGVADFENNLSILRIVEVDVGTDVQRKRKRQIVGNGKIEFERKVRDELRQNVADGDFAVFASRSILQGQSEVYRGIHGQHVEVVHDVGIIRSVKAVGRDGRIVETDLQSAERESQHEGVDSERNLQFVIAVAVPDCQEAFFGIELQEIVGQLNRRTIVVFENETQHK